MRVESSLLINPEGFRLGTLLDNPVKNHELYSKLPLAKAKVIKSWPNEMLIEIGPKIMLIDTVEELVRYYVQYEISTFKKVKLVTQVALWADQSYILPMIGHERLINWTFFNHLLPKADAIAADSMQTPLGKAFWLKRINDALSKGLRALILFRDKGVVIEIFSLDELRKVESAIWGKMPKHGYRLAAITEKPLFPGAITLDEYLENHQDKEKFKV